MHETLSLHPGLIVLRYKKMSGPQTAVIRPIVPHGAEAAVKLVLDPLKPEAVLDRPGDCIIISCQHPAKLHLEILSKIPGEPARGSVTVEYLTSRKKTAPTRATQPETPQHSAAKPNQTRVRYLGHIPYWGDTWAQDGAWLGGPDRPTPIEGLMIDGSGFDQPNIVLRDLSSHQSASSGTFLGSRGYSKPLSGVDLWLEDPQTQFELQAEALFRDAGHVIGKGRFVSLQGAGRGDAMLGFRLQLLQTPAMAHTALPDSLSPENRAPQTPVLKPERVKIFRK